VLQPTIQCYRSEDVGFLFQNFAVKLKREKKNSTYRLLGKGRKKSGCRVCL
jgi:hypothetical protein